MAADLPTPASSEDLQALAGQVSDLAAALAVVEENNGGAFAPINNFYITPEGGTGQTGEEGALEREVKIVGKEEPAEEPAGTITEMVQAIKRALHFFKTLKAKGVTPEEAATKVAAGGGAVTVGKPVIKVIEHGKKYVASETHACLVMIEADAELNSIVSVFVGEELAGGAKILPESTGILCFLIEAGAKYEVTVGAGKVQLRSVVTTIL